MDKFYTKARGKINLSLNVLNKREDGYHNLELTFQIINLYDEIYIEKTSSNDIELYCTCAEFKTEDNLVYKAYKLLKEKYHQITGLKVKLIKHIPTGTGMAGGSADCANFILALNKMFNLNLTKEKLITIGKSLGADVPACMHRCATLGRGIGENLQKINSKLKYYLVIVKPDVSFSTKEMFNKIDLKGNITQRYTAEQIKQALEEENVDLLVENMYNVFEDAVDNKELIDNIKQELIANGASSSLMTGSGSCVYGIFTDRQIAKQAYKNLRKKYLTFITIPYEKKGVNIFD